MFYYRAPVKAGILAEVIKIKPKQNIQTKKKQTHTQSKSSKKRSAKRGEKKEQQGCCCNMLVGHIVSATYFDCGPTMFIDLLNSFVTHLSKFANKYLYLFFCWFKIVSRCNKRSNKNILKRKEEKKRPYLLFFPLVLSKAKKRS